ncbi:methylated-DNA--[protein]-cysteine S-methyltransferase [Flavobacteriales bacterium]|nr:methylated-DNA--[protein]-cysteine S-methyltransferase [Flavobacteriales bacterium]
MHVTHFLSPIGPIEIKEESGYIMWVSFLNAEPNHSDSNTVLDNCVAQLDEYFKGERKEFDLPLAPGGTPFQQKVWDELLHVPFGKTASYMDIAKNLGDTKSTRAVGLANGKNPIAIIIPCHRVIGSDGSLTGYAGGLKRK